MKLSVSDVMAREVDHVLFNGKCDKDHMWTEVDEEAGVGTRYVVPFEHDVDDNPLMKTVKGKFEIVMK